MISKLVAVVRFYYLKYFCKGIRIHSLNPSFIGQSAVVKVADPRAYIELKGRVRLENETELESRGELILGNNVIINKYSRIVAHHSIKLGNDVVIARYVSVLDHDHAYAMEDGNMKLDGYTSRPISIGNNVWIADKVSITRGVTIGDNVIVGANSVVTKDIPSNCVAVGIPARVIKQL